MNKKTTSIIVWTFTFLAFASFFFSLRSNENAMMYSIIALALWGIAFLVNRLFGKNKDEE